MGTKVFKNMRIEWEVNHRLLAEKNEKTQRAIMNLERGIEGKAPILVQDEGDIVEELERYLDDKGNFDLQAFLNAKKAQLANYLLKTCKGGSPAALKIAYQLTGDLVEESKAKVEHSFDGKSIAKIVTNLRRELQNKGMATLPVEPRVVPEKSRLPSGQGDNGDGEVPALASPDSTG